MPPPRRWLFGAITCAATSHDITAKAYYPGIMASAAPPSDGPMSVLFDVWLLSGVCAGYLDGVLTNSGLSGDDFGLYSLLRAFGPATLTQIHRWTGWPTTTVSAHFRRVERRGHLERQPNPNDRRSSLVALSPAGAAALRQATQPFLAAMRVLRPRFVPDTLRERLVLQDLDRILRDVSGLDSRPYTVDPHDGGPAPAHTLTYLGSELTPTQQDEVRRYIEFLRPDPERN
jgi:DNA-binding MarR family transcriptional regulator